MSTDVMTQSSARDRVPRLCQPSSDGRDAPARTTQEGRLNDEAARLTSPQSIDAALSKNARWNLGFSLVVGSWTLALNLRLRTINRAPVVRS